MIPGTLRRFYMLLANHIKALEDVEQLLFQRLLAASRGVVLAVLVALFAALLAVQLWYIHSGLDGLLDRTLWLTLTTLLLLAFSFAMAWRSSSALYRRLIPLEEALKRHTHSDPLTGLASRGLFQQNLRAALLRNLAGGELAVLSIDLDNFKLINDTLNHDTGDALLLEVSTRLRELVPDTQALCRMGGDEFAILLQPGDRDAAEALAHQVVQSLNRPWRLHDQSVYIGASIGIALAPQDGEDAPTLLRCADTAMYQAKENGKNTYQVFTPELNLKTLQHFTIDTSLRRALEHNELTLYYQPQVDVETRAIVGVEALLRWKSAEFGTFASGDFITIAEQSGLINQLGAWAMDTACHQARAWQASGLHGLTVSVNLSARQFHTCDVVKLVGDTLQRTGLAPGLLELEITESVLMRDNEEIIGKLKALTDMGVKLAIDDFGTGYSSLAYLKRLPIHRLKIDKSFVRQSHTTPQDAAIATAIITMARDMGIGVTAEGVENPEQLEFLKRAGCHVVQGYYFGSPLPAGELEKLVRQVRGQATPPR